MRKVTNAARFGGRKLTVFLVVSALCAAVSADVPYDRLCPYLETNGTQAYDSGITGATDMKVVVDMEWLKIDGDFQIFGAINGNLSVTNKFYFGVYRYGTTDQTYCGYGNQYLYAMDGSAKLAAIVGERVTYTVVLEKGLQEIYKDGTRYLQTSHNFPLDTLINMYIFGYNGTGTAKGRASARLYGLQIYKKQDGEYRLVRDFKPAVKDDYGVLYDAVNNTIVNPISDQNNALVGTEVEDGAPDTFLDWVETDGTQFVDTRFKVSGAITYELDIRPTAYPRSGDYTFMGGTASGNRYYLAHVFRYNETPSDQALLWSGYGEKAAFMTNSAGQNLKVILGSRCTLRGRFQGGEQVVESGGASFYLSPPQASSLTSDWPIYLFAAHVNRRAMYFSNVRFYGLTITKDGTDVRVFRPCRKGGRVGIHDAVENRIYYPSVAFSCAADPDAKPVKLLSYVETCGTQFIDTGVIGRSGTTFDCKVEWLKTTGDEVLCGLNNTTLSDDQRRFFLFARYSNPNNNGSTPLVYYSYGYHRWPVDAPKQWVGTVYTNHVELASGRQVFAVNGTVYDSQSTVKEINTGRPLFLLASNTASAETNRPSYHANVRLYEAKIWQDGVLVRDYRPMRMSNGEVTLYDIRNRTYIPEFYIAGGEELGDYLLGTTILFR